MIDYSIQNKKAWEYNAYGKYTIGEIINAVIAAGFELRRFDEHPSWENKSLPGEFTIIAIRN